MNGFSLSVGREGAPLHCAAHSHHPWPDVTLAAQEAAWRGAAARLDHKWSYVFDTVIPAAQKHVASVLNLPDPSTVAFGPNTHSFVLRILSCLPGGRPLRILTTTSEFMSFSRQIARLEEDGLVEVTRVDAEPFDSFETRFAEAAPAQPYDLVFFSEVHFDSGFRVSNLDAIANAVPNPDTFIVIDGYHGFMAVPRDLSGIASRVFYLAGGYKYAMGGEGACFLHCPPGYGSRPRDTGWYAGYSALGAGVPSLPYASDGSRFLGATFDVSGLYRFHAVQEWLRREGLTVGSMLEQVREIERHFLHAIDSNECAIGSRDLLIPDESRRGRFLALRTVDAAKLTASLAAKNIIVDHRGDRLRIGFGIYHTKDDALRLAHALKS